MRLHPAEIERRIGDGRFPTPKRGGHPRPDLSGPV